MSFHELLKLNQFQHLSVFCKKKTLGEDPFIYSCDLLWYVIRAAGIPGSPNFFLKLGYLVSFLHFWKAWSFIKTKFKIDFYLINWTGVCCLRG